MLYARTEHAYNIMKAFRAFRHLLRVSRFHTSWASLPPVSHYEHDVSNVYVAVLINVEVLVIAVVSALATPSAGYEHAVFDIYDGVAV